MRTLLVLTLGMLPSAAFAIDFSAPILDLDGKPSPVCGVKASASADEKAACEKPVTLGLMAVTALLSGAPDESDPRGLASITANEKLDRSELAMKIHDAKAPIDLKAEDVAKIKMLIGKLYPPLGVMRAFSLLDPAQRSKT